MITHILGSVTGDRLNLHVVADSSATILACIPDETLLVVTEHNDTWYAATYGSHTGFVMKQYVTMLNLTDASELTGEVTGGSLNLHRTASTSSDRLIQIPNNTTITVIDFDTDSQWYITDHNGYTGYVMKRIVNCSQPASQWAYGQVTSNALNVRRQPSTSAPRWNNVWPLTRIVLIKEAVQGWYESLYRGQPAYVAKEYINVLSIPVHVNIVARMLFMAESENGRDKSIYFNGYTGKWCHRFADWLAMHAGQPQTMIPDTSNCAYGVLWFLTSPLSGGFFFMQEAHKKRFLKSFRSVLPKLTPDITDSELIYIPQPGDYIYFRWKNAAEKTNVSHVGIVSDIKGDTVYTWEGNSGGKVAAHTYDLSDSRIVGYGHPIYQDE